MKKILAVWLTLILCTLLFPVSIVMAEPIYFSIRYAPQDGVFTDAWMIGDTYHLFLPSSASLSSLTLYFHPYHATLSANGRTLAIQNGQPFNLKSLFDGSAPDGKYTVLMKAGNIQVPLTVMHSSEIASVHITSTDPAKDFYWLSLSKENKAKNNRMVMLNPNGNAVYNSTLSEIRGRGNTTWDLAKKPYQIKLSQKTDLLETGDKKESATTWILLANHLDPTLIRNTVTLELARRIGLSYTSRFRPVDLYYDGHYRGNYLLCEKVEVGDGRVDIGNAEKQIKKENTQVKDFDSLPTVQVQTKYGTMQYVDGLSISDNVDKSYLLEIDMQERACGEKCWFTTATGQYVAVKEPEYLSKERMEDIMTLYRRFENAVLNGGIDPETKKPYTDFVDLDSLVRFYVLREFTGDLDSFRSSTFFYKSKKKNKLYAGPVWDFDLAYDGSSIGLAPDSWVAGSMKLGHHLLTIPSFREAVQEYYVDEFYPLIKKLFRPDDHDNDLLYSFANEIACSRRMDYTYWGRTESYSAALSDLSEYIQARSLWLRSQIRAWDEETVIPHTYGDVPESLWCYDAIMYATENEYFDTDKQENWLFSPFAEITRGRVAIMMYKSAGSPAVTQPCVFTDITEESIRYRDAVIWAYENKIAKGVTQTTFVPYATITRYELIVFLWRYFGCPDADAPLDFTDAHTVPDYAVTAMRWAVETGLIVGTKDHKLLPFSPTTRAEACVIFERAQTQE